MTPRSSNRAAYAACLWAFVFAAMSFYWALGGRVGMNTQSEQIIALSDEPWFVAVVWATGILKVLIGLFALALVCSWGSTVPRRILLIAAWGMGTFLSLYGAANLAVRALMAVSLMNTPDSMRSAAAYWHLVLWDPWWLLGGVLFLLAAWRYSRRSY